MRLRLIIAIVARVNLFVGLAIAFPVALSFLDGERCAWPMAEAMMFTVVLCGFASFSCRISRQEITNREAMLIAALSWLFAGAFGSLPYLLAHVFGPINAESVINCFFESISGFTTTGSSVLGATVPIESLESGLLLWRSLTHWLGGMGIIVLVVAMLPLVGVGGMVLFKSEASSVTHDNIRARVRDTAITLWVVYLLFTVLGTLMLLFGGLSLFDAFCHAVGALATGGFSTRNASIEAYHSLYVEIVIMVIMFLGASSFALHFTALRGRISCYWRNSQFRYYLAMMFGGAIIVSITLYRQGTYDSLADAFRYGTFQTISILSTTGFSSADFGLWPSAVQFLLVVFMFMGGMVGSTSGAIKTTRIVILLKYVHREVLRMLHPSVFASIKMNRQVVNKKVIESIVAFVIFYAGIFLFASLLLSADGMDLTSSFSAVATTMGGVGPGLELTGPAGNFFSVSLFGKSILICCMLLGRLELFTIIVLFSPVFWKN